MVPQTPTQDRPGDGPPPDIVWELRESQLARITAVAWGLAVLYGLLALTHPFVLAEAAAAIMTPVAGASTVFYILAGLISGRGKIPVRWASPAAFLMAVPAGINALAHIAATGSLDSSANAGVVIVAIGIFMGSRAWALTAALLILAGWALLVRMLPPDPRLNDHIFLMCELSLVGALGWFARARFEMAYILARQRAAERAAEAEQAMAARSRFLAVMSHEIRTPLSGVVGIAELLAGTPLTPDQARLVEALKSSASTSARLLSDILDFSRIEQGQLTLEKIDFPLAQLKDTADGQFRSLAEAKGLRFSVLVKPGAPQTIKGDPLRLQQILTNLISNAIKFTAKGSVQVTIEVLERPGPGYLLRLAVTDTGIGIVPEALSRLFQPFAQADASTTRLYGGSGLGLSICRQLAMLMGGSLAAESKPGQGSTFEARVLVDATDKADGSAGTVLVKPGQVIAGGDATGPLTILIADDVELNRFIARAKLQAMGHKTLEASNGEEALAAAAKGGLDLILMDLHMPVMDGATATRRIRAIPGPAGEVPIFALTADAVEEHRGLYLDAGLTDFFTKPINWPILADRINALRAPQAAPEKP